MPAPTFTPTLKMAANAKRGLKLRAKFDRGGTEVGVARAEQLAARKPLDESDVTSMASYFARHAVDKDAKSSVWATRRTRRRAISPGCSGAATTANAGPSATTTASVASRPRSRDRSALRPAAD